MIHLVHTDGIDIPQTKIQRCCRNLIDDFTYVLKLHVVCLSYFWSFNSSLLVNSDFGRSLLWNLVYFIPQQSKVLEIKSMSRRAES